MSYKLDRVPGMTTDDVRKLAAVGIVSTGTLLAHCATEEQRLSVSAKTRIDTEKLAHWASLVDLGRISGVGLLTAERLLACGISSVAVLGTCSAAALADALAARSSADGKDVLSVGRLTRWIQQANALRPMVR